MYGYLTQRTGPFPGATYLLNPHAENVLGRGRSCAVVIGDPLCSRAHAVLVQQGADWRIRDDRSRNGTYVNGLPVREAVLCDADRVRIGSTEFSFHTSMDPPTLGGSPPGAARASVVKQASVDGEESGVFNALSLADNQQAKDLLLIYQLAVGFLSEPHRRGMLDRALACLAQRCEAVGVGYLERAADGELMVEVWRPADAPPGGVLNDSLVPVVLEECHAVWIAKGRGEPGGVADAFCVPVVAAGRAMGALYATRERGSFQPDQFEFAIAVANLTAKALRGASNAAGAGLAPGGAIPASAADAGAVAGTNSAAELAPHAVGHGAAPGAGEFDPSSLELHHWERKLVELALARSGHNVPEAARLLGISRATLYRKLQEYSLR